MGHRKTISSTNSQAAPVQVPAYNVTGILTPDCSCNYAAFGLHDGKECVRRFDGLWFIWYSNLYDSYFISHEIGNVAPPSWSNDKNIITGEYTPGEGCTGIAIVSEGGH